MRNSCFVLSALCLVLGVLALCGGCRREDIRTFEVPCTMSREAVQKALAKYQGVISSSIQVKDGKAEISYDSMQIAQENIRRELH